ncbi:hypothetical protein NC652_023863 [Populus alba x Populus x berolinensis]|nr:hypothetical protein NC652_023863 [Populus alba x Populus x berolinensis]
MIMEIATADFLKTNLSSYGQSYLGFSCCPCCFSLAYRCCVTRLEAILPQRRADQKSVPRHRKTSNRKRQGPLGVDIVAQQRVNSCCLTRKNLKLVLLLHPQKNYDNNQRGP